MFLNQYFLQFYYIPSPKGKVNYKIINTSTKNLITYQIWSKKLQQIAEALNNRFCKDFILGNYNHFYLNYKTYTC